MNTFIVKTFQRVSWEVPWADPWACWAWSWFVLRTNSEQIQPFGHINSSKHLCILTRLIRFAVRKLLLFLFYQSGTRSSDRLRNLPGWQNWPLNPALLALSPIMSHISVGP